jgi:CheY-like chemotaxis protein
MPGIDGIAMVARIPAPAPYVIFTTAHDRYALDAFDAGAIDYLLKPFDAARLVRAVARAESLGMRARPRRCSPRCAPAPPGPLADRLPISVNGRVLLVPVAEISHCVVEHELVTVHTQKGSYTTDYTLAALERASTRRASSARTARCWSTSTTSRPSTTWPAARRCWSPTRASGWWCRGSRVTHVPAGSQKKPSPASACSTAAARSRRIAGSARASAAPQRRWSVMRARPWPEGGASM